MVRKPTIMDRIRYAFDNKMSKGPTALIGWLALASTAIIILVSVVVWLINVNSEDEFVDQVWSFVMLTLEPDAVTFGPWSFRIATLVIVFTSIFVVSMVIGILTTGLEQKLAHLRKGRSKVIEKDHTVILGWSPKIFPIVSELVIANENASKPRIVILGNRDKVEMEDDVADKVVDTRGTKIIYRRGNPMDVQDIELASLDTAKSIIILAPTGEESDMFVIKTLLAITNNPSRRIDPYHVVAEIRSLKNLEVAKLIGKDEVELILTGDLIGRMTAQTCRQSGLSVVYTDLLDFEGDEIYIQVEPVLEGKMYGDALLSYEDSAVIGVLPRDGKPMINPQMDLRIEQGDGIIAISEDDDTVVVSSTLSRRIREDGVSEAYEHQEESEKTLILGWNWRGPKIIQELDHFVPSSSSVMVISEVEITPTDFKKLCESLQNIEGEFEVADTTDRQVLDNLPLDQTDHVIVLAYSDTLDAQHADAKTLVTLLHIRDIKDRMGFEFSITSEMEDIRNRDLAEVTKADDFIVSDRIVSLILSQISENKSLGEVFESLFNPEGSEIYLKPITYYVKPGHEIDFYTVVEAAKRRGETAIGYRIADSAHDAMKQYGVVLNPRKSQSLLFSPEDKVIVLAMN